MQKITANSVVQPALTLSVTYRYRKKRELKPYEWDALAKTDPATRLIDLKVCDPAMGSGHFLVALIDWLADRVLEAVQSAADAVNELPAAAHLVEQGPSCRANGWVRR